MKRKGRVACEGYTTEPATEYRFSRDWAIVQRERAAAAREVSSSVRWVYSLAESSGGVLFNKALQSATMEALSAAYGLKGYDVRRTASTEGGMASDERFASNEAPHDSAWELFC